jgi:hypothetical protein
MPKWEEAFAGYRMAVMALRNSSKFDIINRDQMLAAIIEKSHHQCKI